MFKLPDISNETELVKNMLTDDRKGPEIAKDYGIDTKLLNERMRNQRTFWLNIKEMSNEDIVDAINTIGGSIEKQARWFKLSPTIFRNNVFETLMTDEEFTKMYTKDNSLPEDFSEKIGIPNFILRETMKRRARRLKIHRDKTFNPSMMQRRFYKYPERRKDAQRKREATMFERYGVHIPLKRNDLKIKAFNARYSKYSGQRLLRSSGEENLKSTLTYNLGDNYKYESNKRLAELEGKELDILIDNKYGVEFNGIYWHSTKFKKRIDKYHLKKYQNAKAMGIVLLTVWEPEWNESKNDTLSKILKVINPDMFVHLKINNISLTIENNIIYAKDKDYTIAKFYIKNKTIINFWLDNNIILDGSFVYIMNMFDLTNLIISNDKNNFTGLTLEGLKYINEYTTVERNFYGSLFDVETSGYTVYRLK